MTMEAFREMMDEILEEIPPEYFVDLNGGVGLKEEQKIHHKSVGDELKILGEYVRSGTMGRSIWIYYGSFMSVYGHLTDSRLREEVKRTVEHELTHHLESLAGYKDLEVEDEIFLSQYIRSKDRN